MSKHAIHRVNALKRYVANHTKLNKITIITKKFMSDKNVKITKTTKTQKKKHK